MSSPMATTTPATALLVRAIDRAEDGARAEAVDLAAKAEALAKDAALVHLAAAQIRFAAGDRARAVDPARAGVARAYEALFLRKQGRLTAALAVLDELAERPEHAATAHAFAAEIRAEARDDEGALRHLEGAIAAGAGGA